MPMSAEQRRSIQEQAGLTNEQVEQAVGSFAVHEESAQIAGLTRDESETVRREIRQVATDAALIAAKYNNIARRTDRNPLKETSTDEISADRAHLESLLADEYKFINPFGNIEDKTRTIDVILNGRILYSSYGGEGFRATEGSLRIHGDTAVLISAFKMRGQGEARRTKTGEVYEQNLDGTYRTTHHFARRDGNWQYTASQMTTIPEEREFVFLADEETY
jgi:hypothetical protein